jgi:DNA-binding MarR family transcriptional regulator
MSSKLNEDPTALRARRRLGTAIKQSLRDLSNQISLLNHQVGSRVDVKDIDFDCLDLISQHGPMSPSALAKRAGVHPATVTGIIDRLERDGWVERERDPKDRRAVIVKAVRGRNSEIYSHFSGMNGMLDEIILGYDERQLATIADFLSRSIVAGRESTEELASEAGG